MKIVVRVRATMFRCIRIALIPLILFSVACNRDPQAQSRKLVENGNKFFARAKFKEASIMYRRALGKNQKNADAYYRLGLTFLKLGSWNDAASSFRRTVDLQPNNVDAATKLGEIYWLGYAALPGARSKHLLLEIEDLSKNLLKRDPKSFDGLRFAGYLELAKQDWGAAASQFEKANAVKPFDPDLGIVYAQSLVASNQLPAAEALAKGILDRHKTYAPMYDFLAETYARANKPAETEEILRLKVQNNPKQDLFRVQLAAFYMSTQRRDEMEKVVQGILANKADFPYGHHRVGTFFTKFGDFDRARREFEAGIAEGGEKKPVYQGALVDLLSLQGRPAQALSLAEEILKADPGNASALAQKSALSISSGDPKQLTTAVTDLQSLVSKSPTNHVYRFQLGRALMAKGQPDQAKTHLEEALRLRPTMLPAKLLLAQLCSNKAEYSRALQFADEVIKEDPRSVPARVIRTASLLGMKDVKRAKAELEELVVKVPDALDAQFQLALINFTEGNYKEASTIFERMEKINPGDSRGLVGLVETQIAQRNFPAAVQMAQAAVQKDPKRLDMKVQLGNVLARSGQYDEAVKIFQEMVQRDPKSPQMLMKLGESFRLKGDVNTAIEHYKKASALSPNDTGPLMRVGMLLEGVGRKSDAKPIYEQVVRMDPTNVVALNNLAFMKAEEGSDLDQALAYAQRAKQGAPQDPNVADTLGWVYIKKNLSDDAVRVFQELVNKNPSSAVFRYHLAMALHQKGDRQTAKKQCEQALQNNPSKEEMGKIKELLNKLG